MEIGIYHELIADKRTPQGWYLINEDHEEVLLPNAYVDPDLQKGDALEVFVYLDNEQRPVATTLRPHAIKGEMKMLTCNNITEFGAFFDWGLAKELLVPIPLQDTRIEEEGRKYLVYVMEDPVTRRLVGTTKIQRYLNNRQVDEVLKVGDPVECIVIGSSPLGYRVAVNARFEGLLYKNEVFRKIERGDTFKAYVKKIRDDKGLDLALEAFGYRKVEPGTEKILELLDRKDGFLPLHDKSTPEDIYASLGMSKKVFKKAIGALYKQRIIRIDDKGIRLI
jgi:predicted RNA-binding protein (virulence factor B family)